MNLSLIRVQNLHQALKMRHVRNECKDWMTTNREEITVDQQTTWWFTVVKSGATLEAYLLLDGQTAAGYGILRKDGVDRYWMTAGLGAAYRGRGLGRMLIAMLSELGYQDGRTPWIEVLASNKAALVPDVKSGYRLVETVETEHGDMYIMAHQHDREMDGFGAFEIL